MPYSVLTKDGIQINNIPDNIPRDSDELRKRVEDIRKNRPQQPTDPNQPKVLQEGEGSDFFRGLGTYKDQFGGILGGAEVLAGKAVDSDEMIKSGLQRMEKSEAAIGRRGVKETDEFTKALDKGVGAVLTEYIPFIAGQGVGMIGEAFITATAGAMVGSALAPGAGTVSGALTGLVSKNLVKKGIIDVAKDLGEKERNDLIRTETTKFLSTQAGKQAIKDIYANVGRTAALGTMSAKFGAGEVTGRAIDEAIKDIDNPEEQLQKIKELSTGRLAGLSTAHALANYIGLTIGLGSLEKMAEPTKNVLLNVAKNISFTGLKEAPVEFLQSVIERYGAYLPLTDKAAIQEYINAAAAGFVMPIVPATIGGLRSGPVSPKPNDPNPNIDVDEDIVTTDTIDTKNLSEQEIKDKQKSWTPNKKRQDHKNKTIERQEEGNLNYENTQDVDVNNANIDPSKMEVDDDTRRENEVRNSVEEGPRIGSDVLTPNESIEEYYNKDDTAQDPSRTFGVTVDDSSTDIGGTDDGAGGGNLTLEQALKNADPALRDALNQAEHLTDADKILIINDSNTYDVPIELVVDNIPILDAERRRANLDNKTNTLTAEQRQKLADKRAEANRKRQEKQRKRAIEEGQEIKEVEQDDIQKLQGEDLEIQQSVDAIMDYINEVTFVGPRKEEASTVINLDEAGPGIRVGQAREQKLSIPARVQEFQNEYTRIRNQEGKRQADAYARTRFKDDNFKREYQAYLNIASPIKTTADTKQELKTSTILSNNKTRIQNYQKDNNLEDSHFIREEREIESIGQVAQEVVLSYYLQPRVTLDLKEGKKLKSNTKIANELTDYILKDQGVSVGKEYKIIQVIETKKGGKKTKINPPEIRRFLKNSLNKEQFEEISKDKDKYNKILAQIPRKIKDRYTIDPARTAGTKTVNTETEKRLKDFDASTNPVVEELRVEAEKLGIDIPDFIKTGAVFGSVRSPIEGATSVDDLMKAVLGDYIYEEGMDNIIRKPDEGENKVKGEIYGRGTFPDSIVNEDSLNKRRDKRKEFYDSPLFDAYLSRKNISKNKVLDSAFDNSIDSQIERFEKGQRKSLKYVDTKVAVNAYADGRTIKDMVDRAYRDFKEQLAQRKDQKDLNKLKEKLKKETNLNAKLRDETARVAIEAPTTRILRDASNAKEGLILIRQRISSQPVTKLTLFQTNLIDVLLRVPNLDNVKVNIISPEAMKKLSKEENVEGVYISNLDEQNGTISIVKDLGDSSMTRAFFHETLHAATMLGLSNINLEQATILRDMLVKAREAAAKKGITEFENDYYGLTDIREFFAEAFSNPTFFNFLASVESVDPQISRESTFNSLLSDLINAIKRLLSIGRDVDNTLLGDTIKMTPELFEFGAIPPATQRKINFINAIDAKERGIPQEIVDILFPPGDRMDPAALQGFQSKDKKGRTTSQRREQQAEANEQRTDTGRFFAGLKSLINNTKSYEKLIKEVEKRFANASVKIKDLQQQLEDSNLLLRGVEGFNDIYDQLVLSYSKANDYMLEMLPSLKNYENSLLEYIKIYQEQNPGVSEAMARAVLQDLFLGQHEFERRQIKYILSVPLSTQEIMQTKSGKKVSPAEYREEIMNTITNKEWTDPNERAAAMKKYKQDLIYITDPKTKFSGKYSVNNKIGKSYKASKRLPRKIPLDITDSFYDVSVVDYDTGRQLRQEYENLKRTNPELYNAMDTVRKNMTIVQNETTKLNALGNYAGHQVTNILEFYGWNNYIPLKSKQNQEFTSDDMAYLEPTNRMSRDLKKLEATFDGQTEDAEDPFTQVVVDASLSASRAGRVGYTEAIYNAVSTEITYKDPNDPTKEIKTTAINGKINEIFSYQDRYENSDKLQKAINKKNTVIHFLPDGSLVAIEIKDEAMLKAVRKSYANKNIMLDGLNYFTGKLGQFHTRYNVKFGPVNFARDFIAAYFLIGTDVGLKDANAFAMSMAETLITKKGFRHSFKMTRLYNDGKKEELRKFVNDETKKGNTYPKMFLEYLEQGGMVAYKQALTSEAVFREQQKMFKGSKYAKTARQVNGFFDAYMGMFELSVRVAAFSILKKNYLARNATGLKDNQVPKEVMDAAKSSAAVYAKRLSNFEEVGEFGRTLGAFYMFFRASAVGAARALQTIGPSMMRESEVESNLPDYIKYDPQRLATFRQKFALKKQRAQVATISLLGLGYVTYRLAAMLATGDDEDDTNMVFNDDLNRWTRYARFDISSITGKKGDVFQIPWGFGLGGIPALGAQLGGLIHSNENSMASIFGNMTSIVLDNFAPLPISRVNPSDRALTFGFDSLMPSAIRPLYQYHMNINGFGSPLYNQTTGRGRAYSGGDSTPEMYKDIAAFFAEQGLMNVSPNEYYFFANNYIDFVATFSQNMYSLLFLTARGKQELNLKSDTIIFGSFFNKFSDLDQRAYANTIKKVDKLRQQMDLFKNTNPTKYSEILSDNPAALATIQAFDNLKAQLNKLNAQANQIRDNQDLTPKQKKEFLDYIKKAQLIIKRQMTNAVRQGIPE